MLMLPQRLTPGVERREDARLRAEVLGVRQQRAQGVADLWSAIIVSSRCEKVSSLRRQGCMTHTALDITPQSRHNKSH